MFAYVSLFRGINVGGNRKVKMDELKAAHETLGLRDVLPYIQSGNVVFTSDDADEARLQKQIEDAFTQKFGFHSDVVLRTSTELQEIVAKNPFQDQPDKASNRLVVMFLASHPNDTAQEDLRNAYSGPEEFFVMGKEMYIYYPDGMGRSKFAGNFIEKKLKTVGTARNWNTVLRLRELTQR